MQPQGGDSGVIENRALIHLSNIMIANARAHRFKEMATLAKSKRANERLAEALDTFIGLIGSKTLTEGQDTTLAEAREALEMVTESDDKAPDKTKEYKAILIVLEGIIRAHKWYDMPRNDGGDFNLIDEFYDGGNKGKAQDDRIKAIIEASEGEQEEA